MGGCGWVRPATVSWGPRERTRLANLPSIFATLPSIFAWSKIEGSGRSSKAVVSLVGSCGGGRDAVPATPAAAASPPVRLHPNPSSPTAALTVDRPVGDPLARQAAAVGPLPPGGINAPSPSAPPASGTAAAAAAAASAAAAAAPAAPPRPRGRLPPPARRGSRPRPTPSRRRCHAAPLLPQQPPRSAPRRPPNRGRGVRRQGLSARGRMPPRGASPQLPLPQPTPPQPGAPSRSVQVGRSPGAAVPRPKQPPLSTPGRPPNGRRGGLAAASPP